MGFDTLYDNDSVRRRDRLLSMEEAADVLRLGEYGFLAMQVPEGGAYGVPISYVWDGGSCIYLHCAPEGEKLRLIDRCADVVLTVVGRTQVLPGAFTTAYESILLRGTTRRGLDADERRRALHLLVGKYCPAYVERGQRYAEHSFYRTEVVCIDLVTMSGKCKQLPALAGGETPDKEATHAG